jgi:hypothetical protein
MQLNSIGVPTLARTSDGVKLKRSAVIPRPARV